jgi:hypothetical protein
MNSFKYQYGYILCLQEFLNAYIESVIKTYVFSTRIKQGE